MSPREKDNYHMISLLCEILKKEKQKQTKPPKRKQAHRHRDRLVVTRGGGRGWEKWVTHFEFFSLNKLIYFLKIKEVLVLSNNVQKLSEFYDIYQCRELF